MGLKLLGMGWRSGGIHIELGCIVWLQRIEGRAARGCPLAEGCWLVLLFFLSLMSLLFNSCKLKEASLASFPWEITLEAFGSKSTLRAEGGGGEQ